MHRTDRCCLAFCFDPTGFCQLRWEKFFLNTQSCFWFFLQPLWLCCRDYDFSFSFDLNAAYARKRLGLCVTAPKSCTWTAKSKCSLYFTRKKDFQPLYILTLMPFWFSRLLFFFLFFFSFRPRWQRCNLDQWSWLKTHFRYCLCVENKWDDPAMEQNSVCECPFFSPGTFVSILSRVHVHMS